MKIALLLFSIGSCLAFYINFSLPTLFNISCSVSNESFMYNYAMHRIVRIYDEDQESVEILLIDNFRNNGKPICYNNYLLSGILSNDSTLKIIDNTLEGLVANEQNYYSNSTLLTILDSLSLGGSMDSVENLELLLGKMNDSRGIVDDRLFYLINSIVARTLFLITGKQYSYYGFNGVDSKLYLSEELLTLHEIIVESYGRKRTFSELKVLLDFALP